MINIEQRKQLDAMICDEVNVKAFNRVLGHSEEGEEIVLQYVRSLNSYNWRLNNCWVKHASDDIVEKVLTT